MRYWGHLNFHFYVRMIPDLTEIMNNYVIQCTEIPSDGWWRMFLERQPNLSIRCGDPTAHVLMNAVNQYYTLLPYRGQPA